MWQDYLWTRSHPSWDADVTARNHGNHYLMFTAPNHEERIEMSYRSIGKMTDWDLEKFRLSKKYPDRGNKRRFTKNLFRFVKNPFGYTYWHNVQRLITWNPRHLHILYFIACAGMLHYYSAQAQSKTNHAKWLQVSGVNPEGNVTNGRGYGYHNNSSIGMPFMYFTNLGHQILNASEVVVSPSRNQGYRKYFEMNQKYGLAIKKSGH